MYVKEVYKDYIVKDGKVVEKLGKAIYYLCNEKGELDITDEISEVIVDNSPLLVSTPFHYPTTMYVVFNNYQKLEISYIETSYQGHTEMEGLK